MMFSKSFGYAVRGVLYIALVQDTKPYIQAEEIAAKLNVPRHFISKILKKLVKAGVLSSSKGKTGGFSTNDETKKNLLIRLYEITDGLASFNTCSLRLSECDSLNPCPMHHQIESIKHQLVNMLSSTSIADLLQDDKEAFIKSIATGYYRINENTML